MILYCIYNIYIIIYIYINDYICKSMDAQQSPKAWTCKLCLTRQLKQPRTERWRCRFHFLCPEVRRSRLSARIQVQFEPRSAELRISKDSKDQHRNSRAINALTCQRRLHIAPGRNYALSLRQWKVKLCRALLSCFHLFQPIILGVTRTANQPKLPRFFRTNEPAAWWLWLCMCSGAWWVEAPS